MISRILAYKNRVMNSLPVLMMGAVLSSPAAAHAIGFSDEACQGANFGSGCSGDSEGQILGIFESVASIILILIGAISVVVIIINAFRIVVSNGDSQSVASARNGIIFAVAGLVVAFAAYAIIEFVLDNIGA